MFSRRSAAKILVHQQNGIRRPQIVSLFSNLIYGRVPAAPSPIRTEYKVLKLDKTFMGGKATRKDVLIRFTSEGGTAEMTILVFVPNGASKPVPAFMKHSFNDTRSHDFEAHPDRPGPSNR